MWYVYIVRCNDDTLYTGIAKDLQERIDRHNNGSGSKYARSKRPVTLTYQERINTKSGALKREAEIKKLSRANKDYLIKFGTSDKCPSP